jgi:hypothetical protein
MQAQKYWGRGVSSPFQPLVVSQNTNRRLWHCLHLRQAKNFTSKFFIHGLRRDRLERSPKRLMISA